VSPDSKTILFGHLAFIALAAALLLMQYIPVKLPKKVFPFAMIPISFCDGLWAATGVPKRSGASLLTAILLWSVTGIGTVVIISMNIAERVRQARAEGIKMYDEGSFFFMLLGCLACFIILLIGFSLGRSGYFIRSKMGRSS
jgi:4-hydroxybenzoate polyprenyltransferase